MGKICLIVGTRPEIIKVAPIVMEFRKREFRDYIVVNTGQHKDLAAPYWDLFDLKPDYELDIMAPGSTLGSLTARALQHLDELLNELQKEFTIDAILAQGDTTTVMASSLISFYRNIPFIHLEAGLRSFDLNNPFPEEFNRKVTTIVTQLHLAPTFSAQEQLLKEGIASEKIKVIGNTIVDALDFVRNSPFFKETSFSNEKVNEVFNKFGKYVLITCHRRENHGDNLDQLIEAVVTLAQNEKDTLFVWPVHPNPNVKGRVIKNAALTSLKNVLLTEPLEYLDIVKILSKCCVVISDSGGIQEEAPSFQVPVLVFRSATERNEAIAVGISKLVEAKTESIINDYYNFTPHFNSSFQNPFGDGQAASRATDFIMQLKR
jgi:UDP-N-acetylglucosamine 2-epimerase (non-hydrolysing)